MITAGLSLLIMMLNLQAISAYLSTRARLFSTSKRIDDKINYWWLAIIPFLHFLSLNYIFQLQLRLTFLFKRLIEGETKRDQTLANHVCISKAHIIVHEVFADHPH